MTCHARVTADGQVVFPDELAAELHLRPGLSLIIEWEDGKLGLKSFSETVRETQTTFRAMLPPDYAGSLVDEFIADRREEARRENADHEEWLQRSRSQSSAVCRS